MKRLVKVWILLFLSYVAGRLVVGYAAAGYLPISGQILVEALTIPAFQAIWLVSLLQALEPPSLLRLTARAFRRHPFLGLWLFLDAFVLAAALLTGVHQWLRLTSPAELIYTYFGLRFLLLAGSARRTVGAASIMGVAALSFGVVFLDLGIAPLVGSAVSSTIAFVISVGVLIALLVNWLGHSPEEGVFTSGLLVLFLPVALIQALAALGPGPALYPLRWSTIRVTLGFLMLLALAAGMAATGSRTQAADKTSRPPEPVTTDKTQASGI